MYRSRACFEGRGFAGVEGDEGHWTIKKAEH